MTGKASIAVVHISSDAFVFVICFSLLMASQARENGIISRIGMAIGTGIPFALVFSGINREIFAIMIESGRHPNILGMAQLTIC